MKKQLIMAFLVMAAFFSFAGSVQPSFFKPATPILVRHKVFIDINEADRYIGQCVRDGFIIKQVAITRAGSYGSFESQIVIAEKY